MINNILNIELRITDRFEISYTKDAKEKWIKFNKHNILQGLRLTNMLMILLPVNAEPIKKNRLDVRVSDQQ